MAHVEHVGLQDVGVLTAPDRVRTFAEWCEINGFSQATGRRLLRNGKGPKVIQLSTRRIGIRDSDNRAWQDSLLRR